MEKTQLSRWRFVSLAAAVLILLFVFFISFNAVRGLASSMEKNRLADPSAGFDATLSYDDTMYVVILYGEEILAEDPQPQQRLAAFERSSLQKIDDRIYSGGIIYSVYIACTLVYYIYTISNNNARYYVKSSAIAVLAVYLIYIAFIAFLHAVYHVPFYLPSGSTLFTLAVSLLSVIGGNYAAGILLRKVRFKKLTAIILLPAVFVLSLFSTAFEYGLSEPAQLESFDYIADLDARYLDEEYDGPVYYDDEKNVMVLDDKEYPPKMMDNPDSLRGIERAGALLYEIVFPYSGSSLSLVQQDFEEKLPFLSCIIYIIKSAFWTLAPILIKKKNNEQADK